MHLRVVAIGKSNGVSNTWELPMIGPLLQAENLKLEKKPI
jgi:hypothetical protein